MNQTRKNELLEKIEQELERFRGLAEKSAAAARRAKGFSRSMQGDRRYFEEADRITQESLANLVALKKEIEAISSETAKTAQPISFITLEDENGEDNFYLVNRPANFSGIQLLTPDSPLGKAILGKKEGEKFSYQLEREGQTTTFSGKIKKIE
jgi:transcription elongation GreA/GreB family factor